MVCRSRHTALKLGDFIKSHVCNEDDDELIESISREKFREFETEIKNRQKASETKQDGYILFQDNIYQVYAVNGLVKKITGPSAKEIKRQIKATL